LAVTSSIQIQQPVVLIPLTRGYVAFIDASDYESVSKYDEAARKHFGEFARVNFPMPCERAA
jgi:hypothetical protein